MAYLGNTPTTQSFIEGTDYFNGDGSTTAFTLSRTVVSPNDVMAVINNVVQQPNSAYTISGTTITFTSAPSAGTSNIYVRYLSTTTQSITPSQNTVSYSTLNSDTQSKLGISFKNRIINGAMVIDQRNAGASLNPQNAYTLDRWLGFASQSGKYSVQQNAGSITSPAGFVNYLGITSLSAYSSVSTDYFNLCQPIEGYNMADLNWGSANAKTVTLSFWVRSSLTGTFGGSMRNNASDRTYLFSYTISSANTWEQKSITVTGCTDGTWLTTNGQGIQLLFNLGNGSNLQGGSAGSWLTSSAYLSPAGSTSVVGTNGATFYLTGVQLEVGTQATTFDYRSYGTELQLAMRYYYKLQLGDYGAINGFNDNSTNAICYYQFPVPMRSAPTLGTTGTASNYGLRWAGSNTSLSSVPSIVGTGSIGATRIQAVVASGLTVAAGCGLISAVDTNPIWLAFSAEL